MRHVVYGGAMSLDGYIAGPNGEYGWIIMDPEMDFAAMNARFDTFLIGRKTFEAMGRMGGDGKSIPGIQNIVFSRTLKPSEHPHINISADAESAVAELRTKPGKDIALFGGGELFRSLLTAGLVDEVGVADARLTRWRNTSTSISGDSGHAQTAKTTFVREDGDGRA